MSDDDNRHFDTKLTHLLRGQGRSGVVNPPVTRASTILFPTLDEFEKAERGQSAIPSYGRVGTPSSLALEAALAELDEADHAIVLSSGLAAIVTSLLAFLSRGDHLLMVDSAYGPARRFCDQELLRMGVEVTYYDPAIGGGIAKLIKENTRAVYCESPGSLTFEMQDIPAIAKAAHAKGVAVIADNTWATPLYFRAFAHGVDVSVHSATKYVSGHADLVMGVITCQKQHYAPLFRVYKNLGATAAPDNCYLAVRGLRTMGIRLKRHAETAMALVDWLLKQPEVERILYPALPGDPGHTLWKRDMTGACGLFSVLLKPMPRSALAAMLDGFKLFGMGFSWGGFESLVVPFDVAKTRTATSWAHKGPALRIHAGLEAAEDLIDDLEEGFARLRAANR